MATAPQNPTIYQVAEKAGVSISTVSLAINHPQRVSAETRARVIAAATELGYAPPIRTPGSARPGHHTVAVIAPFSSWPSYALRLGGLLQGFSKDNVEVLVKDVPAVNLNAAPLLDTLPINTRYDAVVLMGVPLSESAEESLAGGRMPVLLVDVDSDLLPSIVEDDERDGRILARHLVAQGHRVVAFLHDHQESFEYVSSGIHRLDGAREVISAAGGRMEAIELDSTDASDALRRILSSGAAEVMASSDDNAGYLLAAMRRAGLEAPTDLSVAGFDDGPLAEALGLTTVSQPFQESGRVAAAQLSSLLQGNATHLTQLTLSGTLVVRASTRELAVDD